MAKEPPAAISPLDSERFGIVVARADDVSADRVAEVVSFCEQHEVELVIARCDGRDLFATRALIAAGMVPVESQLDFRGPLFETTPAVPIRAGDQGDREAVADLARRGFVEMPSHYHCDPRLPLDACLEVYVDWALRGLSGDAADAFLVAEVDGRPAGFTMFGLRGGQIQSLLSTVAPEARGRGVYTAMIHAGMAWGIERGAESLIGVTPMGNVAAQRNLIRLGLAPVTATVTFHGWRDRFETGPALSQ
jgi:GNAT superfamily N-acetyltransferase